MGKRKIVISRATWDWKENDDEILRSLERALEPFGIYVQESFACHGSDAFGFIFSDQELSDEEVEEWERKEDDE